MARRKAPEELSVEELRRLLIEKRRGARRERLEHFKRTGRVADVEPETMAPVVDTLEGSSDQPQVQVSTRRRVMDRFLLFVEVLAVVGLVGVNSPSSRHPRAFRSAMLQLPRSALPVYRA